MIRGKLKGVVFVVAVIVAINWGVAVVLSRK